MSTRETVVAVALTSLLAAAPAEALDRPIDAAKLVLKRTTSRETLVFVSRDPAFLFPTPGSADDPATGSPGGLRVELFSANEGSASLVVPQGAGNPGWIAMSGPALQLRFQNALAPAGLSPVRLALLKQGRVLKLTARTAALPLAGPQGAVGIRVVTGTRRSCALFDAATIKKDAAGLFVARDALAASIADCSDVSLGGPPPTTTTTLPGCGIIPDPFEPKCGGACPMGEQCVTQFSPGLEQECACIPVGVTPCLDSGYPACGGGCGASRVCQGFHLVPGEGPELTSCACVEPGNTCADPPGTCFAVGVCPSGEVCIGQGPPVSACGCGAP